MDRDRIAALYGAMFCESADEEARCAEIADAVTDSVEEKLRDPTAAGGVEEFLTAAYIAYFALSGGYRSDEPRSVTLGDVTVRTEGDTRIESLAGLIRSLERTCADKFRSGVAFISV